MELVTKLWILKISPRHVDRRSTQANSECDKLAPVVGLTKLTILAMVDG